MQFKVKDLMITVMPEKTELEHLCLLRTLICRYPTKYCFCTFVRPTCRVPSIDCRCSRIWPSWEPCQFPCSRLISCPFPCSRDISYECPGGSVWEGITPELIDPYVIKDVEDIAVLRKELNVVLQQLDKLEETGLDVLPETAEDVAALEAKLQEALKAVQAKKAGAKKAKK